MKSDSKEIKRILASQWCDIEDIRKLANVGRNSGIKIIHKIKKDLEKEGKYFSKRYVPTKYVLKYLSYDIEDIVNEKDDNNEY